MARTVCRLPLNLPPRAAQFREGACRWTPSQLDTQLCTHVVYSFAYLTPDFAPLIAIDSDTGELARTVVLPQMRELKRRNRGIKLMLGIGGWSMNDPGPFQSRWSEAVATPANRTKLIDGMLHWLASWGFDGWVRE